MLEGARAGTNGEGLVLAIAGAPGDPYGFQTLAPALTQAEPLTGGGARALLRRSEPSGAWGEGETAVLVAGRQRG